MARRPVFNKKMIFESHFMITKKGVKWIRLLYYTKKLHLHLFLMFSNFIFFISGFDSYPEYTDTQIEDFYLY